MHKRSLKATTRRPFAVGRLSQCFSPQAKP
jgi:hypothetical protein